MTSHSARRSVLGGLERSLSDCVELRLHNLWSKVLTSSCILATLSKEKVTPQSGSHEFSNLARRPKSKKLEPPGCETPVHICPPFAVLESANGKGELEAHEPNQRLLRHITRLGFITRIPLPPFCDAESCSNHQLCYSFCLPLIHHNNCNPQCAALTIYRSRPSVALT